MTTQPNDAPEAIQQLSMNQAILNQNETNEMILENTKPKFDKNINWNAINKKMNEMVSQMMQQKEQKEFVNLLNEKQIGENNKEKEMESTKEETFNSMVEHYLRKGYVAKNVGGGMFEFSKPDESYHFSLCVTTKEQEDSLIEIIQSFERKEKQQEPSLHSTIKDFQTSQKTFKQELEHFFVKQQNELKQTLGEGIKKDDFVWGTISGKFVVNEDGKWHPREEKETMNHQNNVPVDDPEFVIFPAKTETNTKDVIISFEVRDKFENSWMFPTEESAQAFINAKNEERIQEMSKKIEPVVDSIDPKEVNVDSLESPVVDSIDSSDSQSLPVNSLESPVIDSIDSSDSLNRPVSSDPPPHLFHSLRELATIDTFYESYELTQLTKFADNPFPVKVTEWRTEGCMHSLHRIDGPAWFNGTEEKYFVLGQEYTKEEYEELSFRQGLNRQYTCLNGMDLTHVKADYEEIYVDSKGHAHRLDGPAIQYHSGCNQGHRAWYLHGKRHRLDGPAVIKAWTQCKEYWIEGKQYTEEEFNEAVKEKKSSLLRQVATGLLGCFFWAIAGGATDRLEELESLKSEVFEQIEESEDSQLEEWNVSREKETLMV